MCLWRFGWNSINSPLGKPWWCCPAMIASPCSNSPTPAKTVSAPPNVKSGPVTSSPVCRWALAAAHVRIRCWRCITTWKTRWSRSSLKTLNAMSRPNVITTSPWVVAVA
ncbi:hypothetical protein D3C76_1456710 [compost metagenome]